ncbi:MAG: hypothetical protein H7301_04890 [Cryobacterium sp.]|nr:hypothetical protein [Oligoflexia bacterium]
MRFLQHSLFSIWFLLLNASIAFASPIQNEGPDPYAKEFSHIGSEILGMLRRTPHRDISAKKFAEVLDGTRVSSQAKVYLNNQEVDSVVMLPDQRDVLNRARWDELRELPRKKLVLVAHDYFMLMGLDDRNYSISNGIFDRPGVPVLAYNCDTFKDFKVFGKLRLEFLVYPDFFSAYLVGSKGEVMDQPDGTSVIYSFNTKGNSADPANWTGEWLISMNLGFVTRVLSLDYSSASKSGSYRTMDLCSLNPVKTERFMTSCQVIRN